MMNLLKGGEAPWVRKGFDLLMMKRDSEALETFAQGLEKEPKDPTGWLGRGIAISQMGDDRKAMEFFDYALRLAPGMGKGWFRKGISLARLGRNEQALSCFEKVLKLDPDDASTWYHKGMSFEALERYRDAFDCYDQAVRFSDAKEYPGTQGFRPFPDPPGRPLNRPGPGGSPARNPLLFSVEQILPLLTAQENRGSSRTG